MPTIIVSYRRDDTGSIAGRIFDQLVGHFGADQVFMDIDSIPFGLDFREHIQETLKHCDVLLAIVGRNWAAPDQKGGLRINDENDWVRIEVEAALAKKIPVIPVLIDGADLPSPASLPEGLRNLVFRQAAPVDSGRDFHPHMDRLIKAMDHLLSGKPVAQQKPRPAERAPEKTIGAVKEKPAKARTASAPGEDQSKTQALGLWLWQLLISPHGRLSRRTFVIAVILSFVLLAALITGITLLAIPYNGNNGTPKEALIVLLPWNWTLIALGGKRLHDLGWTAWVMAIPVLIGATLIFTPLELHPAGIALFNSLGVVACLLLSPLSLMRGTQGPNRYGPDPLGQTQGEAAVKITE